MFIGLIIGSITGLIPGLHPNTLIPLTLIIAPFLNPISFASLLIGLIISANYFEFIKTTFLSCPDEGDSLSLRFVQKLLLKGRGLEAIKLLSIGALGTTIIIAIIAPLIINFIPLIFKQVNNFILIILISLCFHMILNEGINISRALIIFSLAGVLGVITLRNSLVNQPFLPLLTGFYGLSNILKNINLINEFPSQMSKIVTEVSKRTTIKGIIKAAISSSIITFIPAIGPSQASLIANEVSRTRNEKEKLITLGGVNTGDILFSITGLFSINKARSGVIEQITVSLNHINYLILILISVFCALISYFIVNKSAYWINIKLRKINYYKLNIYLVVFILFITLLMCGWVGLIILFASTLIGLLCNDYKVNPNHLMASLIIPTIIYYL